ncbi:MAG: flagellar basal body rod protein FlgC [Myxococcota bacterium]
MDFIDTINIAGSGLTAERVRLQTVAANMANARTTRTPDGGPYKRQVPIFEAQPLREFGNELDQHLARVGIPEVRQVGGTVSRHEPNHPDADASGYVEFPDINLLHEMVDMMAASRAYEANAEVVDTTVQMAMRAIEIGR